MENTPDKPVLGRRTKRKEPSPRHAKILARHRVVFEEAQKNGGNMAAAIIAAGYAPTTADKPTDITERKSWKALMEEHMPEDLLARRHKELLNKRDIDTTPTGEEVDRGPDTAAVTKGLEMAYKLRGSFVPDKAPATSNTVYNLFYQPKVRESLRAYEDQLKSSIAHAVATKDVEIVEDQGPTAPTDGPGTAPNTGTPGSGGESASE